MDNASLEFKNNLKAYFGLAFRAISVADDFDFTCIMQVMDDTRDGNVIALMWPTPYKNFYLVIENVEEKNGEWWITTPDETWVLRKVDPAVSTAFVKAMKEEGINVA